MKNIEIVKYKNRLDALFRTINSLPLEAEIQSHWARYLCVLASGFLEASTRAIFTEYAKNNASPFTANYVESRLKYFQNAKMNDIIDLAREFSPQWAATMETTITDEQKAAVDSIVSNKNQIAHGRDVGISFVSIKKYYEHAAKVIDLLEKQCNP